MAERSVYLVRHGTVENPRKVLYGRLPGFHLDGEGETSIRHLAERLKEGGTQFSKVYTSPLPRAKESAEIIGSVLGVDVEESDALLEVECKILEGKDQWGQLRLFLRHGFNIYSPYFVQNGVESAPKITERMKDFVDLKLRETTGNFIIVSHGDPINLLLWSYLHPDRDFAKAFFPTKYINYPKKGKAVIVHFDASGEFTGFEKY